MNGYIEELKDRVNDLSSNNNYLKEIFEKQANWSLTSLARAYRIINGLNQTSNQKITRYLIATQSRSGTKHIDSFLRNAYGLCSETLPQHYHSPASLGSSILPKFFEDSEFLYGNSFASDHILPGPKLQQLILGFRITTIVQMRNPAQSCVSLYFNLIESKFITTDTYVPGLQYGPALIENNDSLRSHLIKNIFPRTVAFVRLWMKSLKSLKSLKFAESVPLILFHEQLVNDPNVGSNYNSWYSNLEGNSQGIMPPVPEGQLDLFSQNVSKPECCPSTYTTSVGCVCQTPEQAKYLNERGGNRTLNSNY